MKTRIALITTVAMCAVLLLGATLATPALADQPVYYFEDFQETMELTDCGGGLIISDEFTVGGDGRTYLDQDGNPIKTWVQLWAKDRFFTNQNDLEIQTRKYTYNGFYEYDIDGNRITVRGEGNLWKTILPGYGNIFHIVGLVILDNDFNILKVTPKMEPYYEGDYSKLCAYFAGQLP